MNTANETEPEAHPALRWHLFCRVIDNYGDVGVCWRLAADLAERGHAVHLFCDDTRALSWMAPQGHPRVQVSPWPAVDDAPGDETSRASAPAQVNPALKADVVVEAFGCTLPVGYMAAVAAATGRAPAWINLEYLSAEDYVERSHALPSPQADGSMKWFFFPGFTARTGGLLREDDLLARQSAFSGAQRVDWLRRQGISLQPGERLVSLFCYPHAPASGLQALLADQPTLLLLTPGPAQAAAAYAGGTLRTHTLAWLSQPAYDTLLWACDLNFVRGEDSLVRAIWAGRPWIWQAYAQEDGAQHAKVGALLARAQPGPEVAALWQWWNAAPCSPRSPPPLPPLAPWQARVQSWRQALLLQQPLAAQLAAFVHNKRALQPAQPGSTC